MSSRCRLRTWAPVQRSFGSWRSVLSERSWRAGKLPFQPFGAILRIARFQERFFDYANTSAAHFARLREKRVSLFFASSLLRRFTKLSDKESVEQFASN